jgi:hypothetical protein
MRQQVAVNIQNGWIVHIKNGPFPAGKFSDLKIARERLTLSLEISEFEDEMVLADGGYQDGYLHFETPTGEVNEDQHMKGIARARHETITRRFKLWKILNNRYHGILDKHAYVFMAIANITQLVIESKGHEATEEEHEEKDSFRLSTMTDMTMMIDAR